MIKTFKYKLYKNDKQDIDFKINIACYVYNHCIALTKRYYKMYGKHLNANKLKVHLTKLKKQSSFSFFNKLNAQSIQDIVERIEKGYKAFFNKTAKRFPSFKSKKRYNSFTLKQCGYKFLEGNKIRIGKRIYRYHKSRDLIGIIKLVIVKRNSLGDMYISVICKIEDTPQPEPSKGKSAGFDFGLKTFLVSSDNKNYTSPLFYSKYLSELKKAQRALSRKKKGSSNRHRAKLNLCRKHNKVKNSRMDFLHKLANELSDTYDILAFEDLNIESMRKKWGRKVSDLSFTQFLNLLEYKCLDKNKKFIKIDRFYPSSKTCNVCQHVYQDLTLNERTWTCSSCNTLHDRDLNASINIRARALAQMERSKTESNDSASSVKLESPLL